MNPKEISDNELIYNMIKTALDTNKGLAVGKIGANELNFIVSMSHDNVPTNLAQAFLFNLAYGAGGYPLSYAYLKKFMAENYLSVLPDMDILAVWNHFKDFEIELIRSCNSDCTTVELRSLEPYYFTSHRWTDLLAGKKVLIISPFTDSIAQQIAQKDKVWPNKLLPEFSALYLKFPLSYYLVAENEQSSYPQDSQELLDEFIDQIDELTYDIALIGAGLYSIPLATHCKDNNKVAIHLGGALQVLFGVKGKRWTSMSFINDYWVNPQPHETPQYKNLCEDGCYW